MWFLGLLLGLIAGLSIKEDLAFAGAAFGFLIGLGLTLIRRRQAAEPQLAALRQSIEHIYSGLGDIHHRLAAIESRLGIAQAFAQAAEEKLASAVQSPAAALDATDLGAGQPPPITIPAVAEVASPTSDEVHRAPFDYTPSVLDNLISRARDWLFGGNTVVRVGVIVLFCGVAFLLRYAAQHTNLPIEVRLIGVLLGAIALLAVGWRLRASRPAYALILQGAAVGVLYLTVFGAFRLYHLIDPYTAIAILVAVCGLSSILAILQDSRALATVGTIGGFLAPVLTSTGSGSHVMLFSYYALLNGGIFGIAWFKAWRVLNVIGFAFTFGIGTLWGARNYQPELFVSTEIFLVLFFLFYVAIAILFAKRQSLALRSYVDGTLVFGVPLVAFGLQAGVVHHLEFGLALSCLIAGFGYLALARWLRPDANFEGSSSLRLLFEAFLALGVIFATLAIPLALSPHWTSAAWALEGSAILWSGLRQRRIGARVFGILLQFGAGCFLLSTLPWTSPGPAMANSIFLGALMLGSGGMFSAWSLDRFGQDAYAPERSLAGWLLGWGVLWWFAAAGHEIHAHVAHGLRVNVALLTTALWLALLSKLAVGLAWPRGSKPIWLLPLLVLFVALGKTWHGVHMLGSLGWLSWPLAIAALAWLLFRHESEHPRLAAWAHPFGWWALALVLAGEAQWQASAALTGSAWNRAAWALAFILPTIWLITRGVNRPWPVVAWREVYRDRAALPVIVLGACWSMVQSLDSAADATPLPYIPLLNPMDLAQAVTLLGLLAWWRWAHAEAAGHRARMALGWLGGASGLLWLSAMLLRTLHHHIGIGYSAAAIMHSKLAQGALAVFWAMLALALTVAATKMGERKLWLAGAGLIGAVVAKLFLFDLKDRDSIEIILSLLAVGVLLLVVGYFSPLPPKRRGSDTDSPGAVL